MSIKHTINRNLFNVLARVKYPIPIWKILNHKSVSKFNKSQPVLNEVQSRILADLHATGIATATLDELFPQQNLLETLNNFATQCENSGSTNHKKKFLVDYWDEVTELDINNPFLETALNPVILDVVNSYMEMYTSLLYFTLQKTIPVNDGDLSNSQNWHRDPQEQKVVKVFTYLNDIDENSGPFTYVPHSAPTQNHPYSKLFPQKPPRGSYPEKGQVEQKVKSDDVKPMTGRAGSIMFCDTNGLHYGGVAKTNPRIMSTFGYAAHTYKENKMYYYDQNFLESIKDSTPQTKYTIRPQWMTK